MKIISSSETETAKAAISLAADLKSGDVLLLHGNLGAGKSVFARALIRALTQIPDLEVPSPTFTLVQQYDQSTAPIFHFDLYRIEDPEEIFELGWEDARADGITIVEWPERLGPYKPTHALDISISPSDNNPNMREILINDTRP